MDNNLKKQRVPFTMVPNELLYNANISFKAKGLWAYMSAKPEGWNFSADRIADETKEERKAILAGLKELSEFGFITARKKSDGRIEYTLHWESANNKPKANVVRTSVSEPEVDDVVVSKTETPSYAESQPATCSKTEQVKKPAWKPKRDDYGSDEEYEEAFYKWNSV